MSKHSLTSEAPLEMAIAGKVLFGQNIIREKTVSILQCKILLLQQLKGVDLDIF